MGGDWVIDDQLPPRRSLAHRAGELLLQLVVDFAVRTTQRRVENEISRCDGVDQSHRVGFQLPAEFLDGPVHRWRAGRLQVTAATAENRRVFLQIEGTEERRQAFQDDPELGCNAGVIDQMDHSAQDRRLFTQR